MRYSEMENLLETYRGQLRERRNQELRARLARPCSREELLKRLGEFTPAATEQILLTKSSAPSIMETAR